MARKLRIERVGAIYHVLNRGNYRAHIFSRDKTKKAFLRCLGEACKKTGWIVHAWALMDNHFHLALQTPEPNLVEGMQWLQSTFAVRFNRFRGEQGHLFQGRYKALIVEPGQALGQLCHYLHLNPVRAHLAPVPSLSVWRWTSCRWLFRPQERPAWFNPAAALAEPAHLADTPSGRRQYLSYLSWLSADTAEQKRQEFANMSKGWALGSVHFKRSVLTLTPANLPAIRSGLAESREARELNWKLSLERLRSILPPHAEQDPRKSADWKVALATVMKDRTTATNRWLSSTLTMGSLFTLSRLTAECRQGRRAHALYQFLTARSKT